jgi:hypothetical protein
MESQITMVIGKCRGFLREKMSDRESPNSVYLHTALNDT